MGKLSRQKDGQTEKGTDRKRIRTERRQPGSALCSPLSITLFVLTTLSFSCPHFFCGPPFLFCSGVAELAFGVWEMASQGVVNFVHNPTADEVDLIKVGVGDLAALGNYQSGVRGILALGGGTFNYGTDRTITSGVVWLDMAESWEDNFSNGNIADTYDFF